MKENGSQIFSLMDGRMLSESMLATVKKSILGGRTADRQGH